MKTDGRNDGRRVERLQVFFVEAGAEGLELDCRSIQEAVQRAGGTFVSWMDGLGDRIIEVLDEARNVLISLKLENILQEATCTSSRRDGRMSGLDLSG